MKPIIYILIPPEGVSAPTLVEIEELGDRLPGYDIKVMSEHEFETSKNPAFGHEAPAYAAADSCK